MVLVEEIVRALGSNSATGGRADAYSILTLDGLPEGVFLGTTFTGVPALLVALPRPVTAAPRLTRGLTLRAAAEVSFSRGNESWSQPVGILECAEAGTLHGFACIACSMIRRAEESREITWQVMCAVFSEWESLLARRTVLTGESELGLWGELWLLARTSRPDALLAGWCGPEGASADFAIGGHTFEVKTSRRLGVHHVSQRQLDEPGFIENRALVSLCVLVDQLHGTSLAELVGVVSRRVTDSATLEERLAAVGFSRGDEGAYARRYALVGPVRLFAARSVPRVRHADPGVTDLRYCIELPQEDVLQGPEAAVFATLLSLEVEGETPCA